MTRHVEVRSGDYHDSVNLMQTSRSLQEVDGVSAALIAMGTALNLDLLAGMGFDDQPDAGPNDLVVAIHAADDAALAHALTALTDSLAGHSAWRAGTLDSADPPAATVGSALRRSSANLVLVSVPGASAFAEAMDALEAGRHVMIFSDNVPVEQEIVLKDVGGQRGLLVMGPDCGTAIVQGVALGFANVVQPGSIGIVAASGTGAQQVSCLLDAAGQGISHLLGVGGRDLSTPVGGRATQQALRALDADPATERIIVVSKPAAPEVATALSDLAARLDTPVHLAVLGPGQPDLTTAVEKVLGSAGADVPTWATRGRGEGPLQPGRLCGLFSGGTLAEEAMVIATPELGPIRSNIASDSSLRLTAEQVLAGSAAGHVVIDFGDDTLTAGRAHPMIDPSVRREHLVRCGQDTATSVVLMDVVLGYAADPDPGASLGPAIAAAHSGAAQEGRSLAVVVSLCGTEADPQGWTRQAEALADVGAEVFLSNAGAARRAVQLTDPVPL